MGLVFPISNIGILGIMDDFLLRGVLCHLCSANI